MRRFIFTVLSLAISTLPATAQSYPSSSSNDNIEGNLNLKSEAARSVLTAPSGTSGVPSFRPLTITDLPIGTSGEFLPLLSGANTWSGPQTIRAHTVIGASANNLPGALEINSDNTATADGSWRGSGISVFKNINNSTKDLNGYTNVGNGQYNYLGYGQFNVNQVGSWSVYGGHTNIYNELRPASGRNEATPISIADVPIYGGSFASGQNYYYDFNLQSTPASSQEGYLGYLFALQKRAPGNVLDSAHQGSAGVEVYTTPSNIGFDGQDHKSHTTYPLDAMFAATGFSGLTSATYAGGSVAAATPAAMVGLQIGGPVRSVWNQACTTCRSYIPTGINIQDYTTAAISIGNPSTSHSPSGTAILIGQGGGNLVVQDSIFAGGPTGGGVIQGYKLSTTTTTPGQESVTEYSSVGSPKWQIGKQADNGFFLRDVVHGTNALVVSHTGDMTIGEGSDKTITLSGIATGISAHSLCISSTGVVLLQTSACVMSSARFTDISARETPNDALSKVLEMRPAIFSMKQNTEAADRDINYGRPQIGLVAEEVAAIDTKAAIFEQDGKTPKSYRQESIIALLVGSVRAQDAQIKKLEAANDDLENRLSRLEKLLAK